jgi:hypothetical protein
MRLLQLLLPIAIATIAASIDFACIEEFSKYNHAHHCCHFPIFLLTNSSAHVCAAQCRDKPGCCMRDCIMTRFEIYENGKFNVDNAVKTFTVTHNSSSWKTVVQKSVDKCVASIPARVSDSDVCKDVPDYVHVITACVLKQNFVNCPTFNGTSACQKTLEFVKNPGPKNCTVGVEGGEKFVTYSFYYGVIYDSMS